MRTPRSRHVSLLIYNPNRLNKMVLIEELPSDDEEIPEEVPTGTKGMRPALLSATSNAASWIPLLAPLPLLAKTPPSHARTDTCNF